MKLSIFVAPIVLALSMVTSCTDEPGVRTIGPSDDAVLTSSSSEYPRLTGDYAADCAGYAARMRDCGLLSPGPLRCSDPTDPAGVCVFECLSIASCGMLAEASCAGELPGPLSNCYDDCTTFACGSGEIVSTLLVCNGPIDCADRSDEANCDFQCSSGEIFPASYECDFFPDCADSSDEIDCQGFACDSGEMVNPSWHCDGEEDCLDGSDELGCVWFHCHEGGSVIPPDWECDGEEDCLDGSDEFNCARLLCR